MGWKSVKKNNYADVISFLKTHEYRCVSLTSRLLHTGKEPSLNRKGEILVTTGVSGNIEGVLYVSPLGSILPVFTDTTVITENDKIEIRKFTRRFLRKPHSIIGTKKDVSTTESILSFNSVSKNNYYLMSKENGDLPTDIPQVPISGLTIRKATIKDAQKLFPLQKNYELEEVLTHVDRFNPSGCMAHLKQNLAHQIILCAEIEKHIVAKGGTNGTGFNYYQMGGIYTLPSYRNQGISTALVIRLIQEIVTAGKKACLFVKTGNAPALRVYKKLGFSIREDFTVSYFF